MVARGVSNSMLYGTHGLVGVGMDTSLDFGITRTRTYVQILFARCWKGLKSMPARELQVSHPYPDTIMADPLSV